MGVAGVDFGFFGRGEGVRNGYVELCGRDRGVWGYLDALHGHDELDVWWDLFTKRRRFENTERIWSELERVVSSRLEVERYVIWAYYVSDDTTP